MQTVVKQFNQLALTLRKWVLKIVASLGGRTIAMLTIALLVTLASIVFNDNWILTLQRQDASIGRARDNIIELNMLSAELFHAESAQRGYLLMHQPEYLTDYATAVAETRQSINKITESLIKDSPEALSSQDREWLSTLPRILDSKTTEMQLTVSLAMRGNVQMAKQLVNLGKGTQDMERFIDQTNALITKQNQLLASRRESRNATMSMARQSLVGGALFLIFLVVLVLKQLLGEISAKNNLQLQLSREIVTKEQMLKDQSQLLNSLALNYQSYVESERQQLSRELHDEIGSILTATKMDLSWVMKKAKDTLPEIVEKLTRTNSYLDKGINFKRQIVESLHPSLMTTLGLWPALKSLVGDAADRNQWQLTLNVPEDTSKVNETISLIAYRVVQESLNNASKYAEATKVSVDIITDGKYLKLEITDNGKGFDVGSLDGNTHGLAGMRHRVLAIGGKFEITSAIGEGTSTWVLIPLKPS
ncbi:MAG TPA: CHASE3 domain-containing protein [Methylophilaceae bacterium]